MATRSLSVWLSHATLKVHHVTHFDEVQVLGQPAEMHVELVTSAYTKLDEVIGLPARLVHSYAHEPESTFAGIVENAAILGRRGFDNEEPSYVYRLRLVSQIGMLERAVTCRIFQDSDVKDIIRELLKSYGVAEDHIILSQLHATYAKRPFTVQYRESALAFVSRLCEEEGIYFYSTATGSEPEKFIFVDDSTAAATIEGDPRLAWQARTGLTGDVDHVFGIRERQAVRSGKFVLRDYNFEKPKLDLEVDASADVHDDLEVYDYPGGYDDPSQGKRIVKARLEAEQAERHVLGAQSNTTRLAVGQRFEIAESEGYDGEYFITALSRNYAYRLREERARAASELREVAGESYVVTVSCIPAKVKYRPPRRTPKPLIHGPQTAIVVAPENSPAETIHTDEHGRIKVAFMWDRSGAIDDKASAWFRTAQLQLSGSMILPRVGWEVLVEFLEGDPDKPIITGRLYNGMFMPPYALPEGKTRTVLRTASTPGGGGTNEIRFEDKAGAEEIMMHSQHNTSFVTANNKTKNVGNNETQVIGNNATFEVGANQDTKITKGCQNTIKASQTVTVGGNRKVEVNAVQNLKVGGNESITVGGNQFEMVGNPLEGLLAVAAERAAELATMTAERAIQHVEGVVQGAIGQVMGPVDQIIGQAQALGSAMNGAANGDLSAAGALVGGAGALPGAGQVLGGLRGPPAPAAMQTAPGAQTSAGAASGANALRAAAAGAIARGMSSARDAVGQALGGGGSGGGSQSGANRAGPGGAVSGVDESNTSKGPGHSHYKIGASHTETSAALRVMAALNGINTNVAVAMTQSVGAAYVELVLGNHAESTEAVKTENSVGLIAVTGADETEQVGGAKSTMVGGAIVHLVKGSHAVQAKGPATFIGAFHKMQAQTSVTFKGGDSEVVVDGGGITFKASGMIMVMAGKIQLTKKVDDA